MSKILIVDDNPKNLQVLANALSGDGYEIEYAENGQEAVDIVTTDSYDLILMDVMMPILNGFKACEKIKKIDRYKEVPVIFLTAKTDEESISIGFDVGGVDFVTKPFNSKELLARVRTHIELKEGRDRLKGINEELEQKVEERTQELNRSNQELKDAHDKLSILDEAKNSFLRIISHELRTPLNGIMGILHLVKKKVETKEMAELITLMDNSVNRLEKFSFQALKITQLQTDKYALNTSKIRLLELIEVCVIEMSNLIKEKEIEVDISDKVKEIELRADIDLLVLAFTKILENAIEHSNIGTKILVGVDIRDSDFVLQIADSGDGFSVNALKSTFDLFSTGNEHVNLNVGIDMPLVKLIIEKHKGNVSVENIEGGGAVVNIQLSYIKNKVHSID